MYKYLLGAVVSLGTLISASGAAYAQAKQIPAPGTIVVHLNGLINVEMNGIWSSVDKVAGFKLNPVGMSGEFRLYPGFDATAANGLEYGASGELRTAYTPAGVGMQESGTTSEAMVLRRAWVYVGSGQYGYLRAGQTDGPWDLLTTGEYYNWGDHNGWNSDGGIAAGVPGAAKPSALFTSSGVLYTTNKVVYLSPKLMGFEAGVSYEPNSNAFKEGQTCSFGGTGYTDCATLFGGPLSNATRRRDTVTAAIEYINTFDAVGVTLSAAYLHSAPALPHIGVGLNYRELSVPQLSAQVTYAGFLLGANVKFGQVNNGYAFLRPGARDLLFYNLTGEYTMGPYTLAVNYFNNQAAGAWSPTNGVDRTESDYGIGAGADYELAKGMTLYAMYLYGHRHEPGFNFVAAAPGSAFNNTNSSAFTVGTVVTW